VKPRKTLEKILSGSKNIRFEDLTSMVKAFGFHAARTAAVIISSRDRAFLSL
jgi:hypothetical protein